MDGVCEARFGGEHRLVPNMQSRLPQRGPCVTVTLVLATEAVM